MTPRWTRRACLAGALAAGLAPGRAAAAPRLASLDWGWTSMLLALGVMPVGIAEERLYRAWVVTPAIPAGIPDVGLRGTPSFETLASLKPDLILSNGLNGVILDRLETIAPTLSNPTFTEAKTPLANARAALRLLGERCGRVAEAEALLSAIDARFTEVKAALSGLDRRAYLPVTFVDAHHLAVYGDGSLFADVLHAVGLRNLTTGPSSIWGHVNAEIADLARVPPGNILVVEPVPPEAERVLQGPSLFTSLCAAAGRRIIRVPAVWGFGDVTAARRFADILLAALGAPA